MVFRSFRPANDGTDRDLACEAYLEPAFEALINRALADGWSEDEIANALLSLAQTRIESMRSNAIVGADVPGRRLSH